MIIKSFVSNGDVFSNFECVTGYAYVNAVLWVKSALLSVICAVFGLSQDSCVHLNRIECLLPQRCIS